MVQAEASGKTCFDIGEAQPIDAERAGWGEYDKCLAFLIILIYSCFWCAIPLCPSGTSPSLGEELSLVTNHILWRKVNLFYL